MAVFKAHFDGKVLVPDESVDLPQGCTLVVRVEPEHVSSLGQVLTGQRLLESGLVGIWRNRSDIGDSRDYARRLREKAQHR